MSQKVLNIITQYISDAKECSSDSSHYAWLISMCDELLLYGKNRDITNQEFNRIAKKVGNMVDDTGILYATPKTIKIHNGIYTLTNTNTKIDKILRIRTVIANDSGLIGKRIIALQDDNARYGWKGFGFVIDDKINLWSSFKSRRIENNNLHEKIVDCFLDIINNPTDSKYFGAGMVMSGVNWCVTCNDKGSIYLDTGLCVKCSDELETL